VSLIKFSLWSLRLVNPLAFNTWPRLAGVGLVFERKRNGDLGEEYVLRGGEIGDFEDFEKFKEGIESESGERTAAPREMIELKPGGMVVATLRSGTSLILSSGISTTSSHPENCRLRKELDTP